MTKQFLYTNKRDGSKVYQYGNRRVTAGTIYAEDEKAKRRSDLSALMGSVVAGTHDGRYYIGTVVRVLVGGRGTLVVKTRGGNIVKVPGAQPFDYAAWDKSVADPENGIRPEQVLP